MSAPDHDSPVAACDCGTKTPDIKHHLKGCRYRLIEERDQALKDTKRLSWLEDHLHNLTHASASSTVYMGGERIFGRLNIDTAKAGPRHLRVCHRSIRAAVDEAMSMED